MKDNNIRVDLPTTVVIFGATGDLGKRKLFPAFYNLYSKDILPEKLSFLGVARSERTNEDFRDVIKSSVSEFSKYKNKVDEKRLNDFAELASYRSGVFEDMETYRKISEHLLQIDEKMGVCSNKLFYLAVPPENYASILKNLERSGLTIPCSKKEGWTRVLIEKPFGSDYKTARDLDMLLGKLFREEQIFRIDHYLAKDTIQNILTFRFTNAIFEPIWNKDHIEKVEIGLFEKLDLSQRGAFYDGIGALRDVGQNHILQILAAIAMENPGELSHNSIRKNRADLLSELKMPLKKEIEKYFIKGQYRGYKNEAGVANDSKTETYFKVNTFLNSKRWKGVPFILESGKAMNESKTEAKIFFKEQKPCFCVGPHKDHKHQNVLTFNIQPNEAIYIDFFIKKPMLTMDYMKKELCFSYGDSALKGVMPDAYEKILFDCMIGDQTLFTSTSEVLSSWKFVSSIIDTWRDKEPIVYEKGSFGPN